MKIPDLENPMVIPDAGPDEPIHKEENDGGEQRQRDTDDKWLAKLMVDGLIKRMEDGEFNP